MRLTYRSFRTRLGRLACVLASLGAREGTVVGVMDWDSHRYLESYFAVPMMGAVLLTVNVRLAPAEIADTIRRAGAEILLVHRDFFPLLDALRPSLAGLRAIIAIRDGEAGDLPADVAGEYEDLLGDAPDGHAFGDFDERAVATTFFTTGTTGAPKQVSFTHRQIVLHALASFVAFAGTRSRRLGVEDVYMPLTPMFHVHAWGVPYVATMLGCKQVYPGRYEPGVILGLREREGVSFSHCVPTVLAMVVDAAIARGTDLSGWLVLTGGAALTPTLWRQAAGLGMEVFGGYGMSEAAPIVSITRPARNDDGSEAARVAALTANGTPLPLVSVRIVDPDGHEVAADGVSTGELVVRAPWLAAGYDGDQAASDRLWQGGWLRSGDVFSIDREGSLRIRDRLRDLIKTGGEWLRPSAIEDLLAGAAGIATVAVIGVPDPRWGERPIAIATAEPGRRPSLAKANAVLAAAIDRGTLSRYARLERLVLVDALPLTSVGKVDKKRLRADHADLPAPTPSA